VGFLQHFDSHLVQDNYCYSVTIHHEQFHISVNIQQERWKKIILDSVSKLDRLQPDMRKKIYDEITRQTGGKSVKKSNLDMKLTKTIKC
jgi:hypothetical protein